jgi:hypothetical protein
VLEPRRHHDRQQRQIMAVGDGLQICAQRQLGHIECALLHHRRECPADGGEVLKRRVDET